MGLYSGVTGSNTSENENSCGDLPFGYSPCRTQYSISGSEICIPCKKSSGLRRITCNAKSTTTNLVRRRECPCTQKQTCTTYRNKCKYTRNRSLDGLQFKKECQHHHVFYLNSKICRHTFVIANSTTSAANSVSLCALDQSQVVMRAYADSLSE